MTHSKVVLDRPVDHSTLLMDADGDPEAAKEVIIKARADIPDYVAEAALKLMSPAQHRFIDMLVVKDGEAHRHSPEQALSGAQEFQQQNQQYWQSALHE